MKCKIFLLAVASLLLSCSSDSLSDLQDNTNVTSITYTNNVKAIIDANCLTCHGNNPSFGASTSLTSYINVKNASQSNNLLERISKAAGSDGAMPEGGPRLSQQNINTVSAWITENYQQ
jgi:mono/diheme cytochrome c family protein